MAKLTKETKELLDLYAQEVISSKRNLTFEDRQYSHFWPLTLIFAKELTEGSYPRLLPSSYSFACLMYLGRAYGFDMITRPRDYNGNPRDPAGDDNVYIMGAYESDSCYLRSPKEGTWVKEHDVRKNVLERTTTISQ